MATTRDSAPAEDWNSYRKLIIDTLRRLDERTLALNESLQELHTRVTVLEKEDSKDELARLDKEIIALRVEVFQFKTKDEAKKEAAAGAKRTHSQWINAIWAAAAVLFSAILNGYFLHYFGK